MIAFMLAVAYAIYIICQPIRRVYTLNIINSANISAEEIKNIISSVVKKYNYEKSSFTLTQNKSGYSLKLKKWNQDARCSFLREINAYVKRHGERGIVPMIFFDAVLLFMCICLILYRVT
jgi:hypothetical protein